MERAIAVARAGIAVMFAGLMLFALPARAQDGLQFVDWLGDTSGVQTGGLHGRGVTLTGTTHAGGNVYDGSFTGWDAEHFSPRLAASDVIEIEGRSGNSFTLNFGAPVKDPIFHVGTLASTITFPAGTPVEKLSGESTFTVSGSSVSGVLAGQADSNGTIRLTGVFESLTFTAVPTFGTGTSADGIYLQVGGLPVPPPPPPGVPPPPPAPPSPPVLPPLPVVTGITASGALSTGGPGLLSALVSGTAKQFNWDINGDGRVDASCPGNQTSLRFRPPTRLGVGPALLIDPTVRAVGDSGVGPLRSVSVAFSPPTSVTGVPKAGLDRISDALSRRPTYVCANSQDYVAVDFDGPLSRGLSKATCMQTDVVVGPMRMTGCWHGIARAEDIPIAERGVLRILERELNLPPESVAGAVKPADFLIAEGAIKVNGVDIEPAGGAKIVVNSAIESIVSSNAAINVGGIRLKHAPNFRFNTRSAGDRIRMGTFPRLPGGRTVLGFLGIQGDVTVDLVRGNGLDAYAEVTTTLTLPLWLGGGPAESKVRLRRNGTFELESMSIGPLNFRLGPIGITDLRIAFRNDRWFGQLKLCVTDTACIDATPAAGGGVEIGPGETYRVAAVFTFPGQGLQLFPPAPVFLTSIGADLREPPLRLIGTAKVRAAGIYEIDGALAFAFPSAQAPYRLDFGNFPAEERAKSFERFVIAASATAFLSFRPLPRIRLGDGYFLYHYPNYVSFGGGVDTDLFGVFRVIGTTSGWFDLGRSPIRFNLHARADSCFAEIPLLGKVCWGSVVNISSRGAGGCVSLGITDVGGGVIYSPFRIRLWLLKGCKWSPFAERMSFLRAVAQVGTPLVVTTERGDPSQVIELRGTDGAPRIRVTTANGRTLVSSDGPGLTTTNGIHILRSETLKMTVVGLVDPAAGDHRIEPLPGSPAIVSMQVAEDQPAARVTARVSGTGLSRTLTYDIRRRRAQRVTFLEIGPGGSRVIGTATGGRGRLRFNPAPGSGVRAIEAQFELDGLPAERLTVARFRPPSSKLARVQGIRGQHLGATLQVAWHRVPEARSYEVVATLRIGGARRVVTTRRTVTLRGIPRWSAGRVTVRALAPLRQGPFAGVSFRANGPRPKTRLEPLPGARRGTR